MVLVASSAALIAGLSGCGEDRAAAAGPQEQSIMVEQATKASEPDPAIGHTAHELVVAVPARTDGKLWSGTVTYAASEPVEVVVLHGYDTTVADETHADAPNAELPDGSRMAVTLIKPDSGTALAGGSLNFSGSLLAFHNLDGKPFTVTYTVTASASAPTS